MRKIYDIRPPRRTSGTSPAIPEPRVAKDLSTLDVQPHDLRVPAKQTVVHPPVTRPTGDSAGKKVLIAMKRGTMYLLVGLISFAFFSLLFYGYNRYQDRRRSALEPGNSGVSGVVSKPPSEISLRILNGSGRVERLAALQQALESNGYNTRSVGTASQSSERTIIYFRARSEEAALVLAQNLSQFAPSLEKNDDLTGVDDVVILLGSQPPLPGVP